MKHHSRASLSAKNLSMCVALTLSYTSIVVDQRRFSFRQCAFKFVNCCIYVQSLHRSKIHIICSFFPVYPQRIIFVKLKHTYNIVTISMIILTYNKTWIPSVIEVPVKTNIPVIKTHVCCTETPSPSYLVERGKRCEKDGQYYSSFIA